jgi:hypothetical protein
MTTSTSSIAAGSTSAHRGLGGFGTATGSELDRNAGPSATRRSAWTPSPNATASNISSRTPPCSVGRSWACAAPSVVRPIPGME